MTDGSCTYDALAITRPQSAICAYDQGGRLIYACDAPECAYDGPRLLCF